MNILVTGANGQLGHEMQICAKTAITSLSSPMWLKAMRNWTSPTSTLSAKR